ncbi:hypothetical protein [Methanocella arvoryzae]|nr:hypothetical protein [Methanocella arvoryzae]
MKLIGSIIGSTFIAGLIISNITLLIACFFLYKLILIENDPTIAKKAIKYTFLFPVAFIYSGVFTESLYLALLIMCFYYARKEQWHIVGLLGLFLSLTRSLGVFVIFPMLLEYLAIRDYKVTKVKSNVLYLLLIPVGLAIFSVYNFYFTGDFFAFIHIQSAWGRHLDNPLNYLLHGLFSNHAEEFFWAFFTVVFTVLLIAGSSLIRPSYLLVGVYSIIIPLSSGIASMPRYFLAVFPLYIIMAKLTKNKYTDMILTALLIIVQCYLMALWAIGSPFVM